MARLRINQGLNLTLDASTTDFIVKSLSGPRGDLLLNGRYWGVEIRIDEDNSGDQFLITKGTGGSTPLLTVYNNGSVNIGGFELRLGTTDQTTRGNSGASRALVKDSSATLAINFGGDFTGGVRVDGPGMNISGNLTVYGNQTVSGEISGRYDHANRFVVQSFLTQSSVTVSDGSSYLIAATTVYIPTGRSLYLKRVRWHTDSPFYPRIILAGGPSWTGSSSTGDVSLDVTLYNGNNTNRSLQISVYNSSSSSATLTNGSGIWAEFEIR